MIGGAPKANLKIKRAADDDNKPPCSSCPPGDSLCCLRCGGIDCPSDDPSGHSPSHVSDRQERSLDPTSTGGVAIHQGHASSNETDVPTVWKFDDDSLAFTDDFLKCLANSGTCTPVVRVDGENVTATCVNFICEALGIKFDCTGALYGENCELLDTPLDEEDDDDEDETSASAIATRKTSHTIEPSSVPVTTPHTLTRSETVTLTSKTTQLVTRSGSASPNRKSASAPSSGYLRSCNSTGCHISTEMRTTSPTASDPQTSTTVSSTLAHAPVSSPAV